MGASVSTRITRLPSRVNRDQARRALGSKHWSDKRWDGIPKEADGRVRRDHLLTALEDHIDDAPVAAVRAGGAGGGAGAAYTSSTSTITSRAGSSSSSSDPTTSSSSTTVTVSAASATGTSTSTGTSTQSKSVKKQSGPSPLSPAAEEAARNHPSVRMAISYGRQASDKGSASLLKAIGGSARLRSMASRFYQKAFKVLHARTTPCLSPLALHSHPPLPPLPTSATRTKSSTSSLRATRTHMDSGWATG